MVACPACITHPAHPPAAWNLAKGYLGLPAHAWVCGACAGPPLPDGTQSFSQQCGCVEALGFLSPHAAWDVPPRYYLMRDSCPGFLADSHRDPRALIGDKISAETRNQRVHYVSAHDGQPALRRARSASTEPPSFD